MDMEAYTRACDGAGEPCTCPSALWQLLQVLQESSGHVKGYSSNLSLGLRYCAVVWLGLFKCGIF